MAITVASSGTKASQMAATFTVTIASPAVFTLTAHGFVAGDIIRLATSSALPTGLVVATDYYVISAGLSANAFEVSTAEAGSAVNTSGSQSGTQTIASLDALLYDTTAAGTYQLGVDKVNMIATDFIEMRVQKMYKTGGSKRGVYYASRSGVQPTDDTGDVSALASCGLTDTGAVRFRLKHCFGAATRNFDWEVLKFA